LTEADIRLFVTLVRFDAVYVLHFKCNRRRIVGRWLDYKINLLLPYSSSATAYFCPKIQNNYYMWFFEIAIGTNLLI